MIRRLQFAPIVDHFGVVEIENFALKGIHTLDCGTLHWVPKPGGKVAVCVCPGYDMGHINFVANVVRADHFRGRHKRMVWILKYLLW